MSSFSDRVAATWTALANVEHGFRRGAITVAVAVGSQICPPGWNGAVRLGDAALITTPTDDVADRVKTLVSGLRPEQVCDPARYLASLPAAKILGPATLAYLDAANFRPVSGDIENAGVLGSADAKLDARIAELEDAAGQADADEAGVSNVTSPLFVARENGVATAVCGYRTWIDSFAHMCVLVHPDHRGKGLAKAVATAATGHALAARLIPQWRARPPASIAISRALGFTPMGDQLSFHL